MFLIDSVDLYHFSIFWLLYGSFDTKKLTPEFCINIYSFKYWSILGLNIVIIEALEKKKEVQFPIMNYFTSQNAQCWQEQILNK